MQMNTKVGEGLASAIDLPLTLILSENVALLNSGTSVCRACPILFTLTCLSRLSFPAYGGETWQKQSKTMRIDLLVLASTASSSRKNEILSLLSRKVTAFRLFPIVSTGKDTRWFRFRFPLIDQSCDRRFQFCTFFESQQLFDDCVTLTLELDRREEFIFERRRHEATNLFRTSWICSWVNIVSMCVASDSDKATDLDWWSVIWKGLYRSFRRLERMERRKTTRGDMIYTYLHHVDGSIDVTNGVTDK